MIRPLIMKNHANLLTIQCSFLNTGLLSNNYTWSKWKSLMILWRNSSSSVFANSVEVEHKSEKNASIKQYAQKIIHEYEAHQYEKKPLTLEKDVFKIKKILVLMNNIAEIENNIKSLIDLQKDSTEDEKFSISIRKELKSYQNELSTAEKELLDELVPVDDLEKCTDIVVEIGAGVGGQEAMLFSKELVFLYQNYAAFKGWNCKIDEDDNTSIGGSRKASLIIKGANAFKMLQFEGGVHRVQRVPQTENHGRMHTSTASIAVYPEPSEVDIDLKKSDLIFVAKTSSAPGGQHVNKIKTAVRVTHIPSGLVTECQENRSHEQNRKIAVEKLRLKLFQIESEKTNSKVLSTRSAQIKTKSRNEKVRTYNYQQDRITDHRFRLTVHNIEQFLSGAEYFDDFLNRIHNVNNEKKKEKFLNFVKLNNDC